MNEISIPEPIAELMECFRADVDDLHSEDFAPLAEWLRQDRAHQLVFSRLQELDRQIMVAVPQVVPPPGLPGRLKQRSGEYSTLRPVNTTGDRRSHRQRRVFARARLSGGRADRRWLTSFRLLGSCTAAVVLISAFLIFTRPFQPTAELAATSLQPQDVGQEAIDWSNRVQGQGWTEGLDEAPATHPVYGSLAGRAKAWTTLPTELDEQVVAYDLSTSEENPIHLFVVQALSGIANVSADFSSTPTYASNMFSTGVCRKNNLTYVLVVKGGIEEYRDIVEHSTVE